jgi:hypothetical protein
MLDSFHSKLHRVIALTLTTLLIASFWYATAPAKADTGDALAGDALQPPPPRPALASADTSAPSLYQPSAFLAGKVAVQVIFVESDGSREPSHADWTPEQIAAVQSQIAAALEWWRGRVPNARVSFDLTSRVIASGYEPIDHTLATESAWIGDVLTHAGLTGATYFDQSYAAAQALRQTTQADWATTIFVVNSAGDADGRFADGHFAYAYVGGPFLVVTSDAGPYGTGRMAPVVAHEFGHIFGALDQYASAATPCAQQSGYLAVPTTNSQANNCGTRFVCVMLEPLAAYPAGLVDESALGQIGYRDTDGDGIPDPLDTAPTVDISLTQPPDGGRPSLTARAADQPYPTPLGEPATINTIAAIEYRADGGAWIMLPAADGAYDSATETTGATLPLYDGQHTIEIRAINSVGAASPLTQRAVTVNGVGPAPAYRVDAPSMSNSAMITLTLDAPSDSSAQISESPLFADAAWAPVQEHTPWSLGESDGAHTIYVRFRDRNGLESPPLARQFLLDRAPPSGRATRHTDLAPWIELHAQDSGSGVAAVQLIDAEGAAGDWQAFQPALALPPQLQISQIRLRDAAGNSSEPLPITSGVLVYLPFVSKP